MGGNFIYIYIYIPHSYQPRLGLFIEDSLQRDRVWGWGYEIQSISMVVSGLVRYGIASPYLGAQSTGEHRIAPGTLVP